MKSIKVLIPSALTFMLFLGFNQATAQRSFNDPVNNSILAVDGLKKSIGLDYKSTLVEINNILEQGVKADHEITFRGKVMIHLNVDPSGNIESIKFDRDIPSKLKSTITASLIDQKVAPVQLNGIAKSQSFKIPVVIN